MRNIWTVTVLAIAIGLVGLTASVTWAGETTWTWNFTPAAGDEPAAAVTPVKYGKAWAYVVQIDDAPITMLTITGPLLKNYEWTDAPPGVAGGTAYPFVGDAALLTLRVGGNSTYVDWNDLQALRADGWGVTNHGYWHTGYGWDPAGYLTEAELRRELYWAQQVIALKMNEGAYAPSHFVYPNGYTAFMPYLTEYGLLSGARVGGSSTRVMSSASFNPLDMTRTYLDDGNWTGNGGSDPMYQFPASGPEDTSLFIDFTHGMGDPGSDNYVRWQTRLGTIAAAYGAAGTDEIWSAGVGEVIAYHKCADAAAVSVTPGGQVTLTVPDSLPGAALTVRIDGISPSTQMTAPEGGLLYRGGTTAWVTTPMLNAPESPMPEPDMAIVYDGPFASHIELPYPIYLAAIRLHSVGNFPSGYYPTITLTHPDQSTEVLPVQHILDQAELGAGFGKWYIFPTLPDYAAAETIAIDIADPGNFSEIEIYAVEDGTLHPINLRPTVNAGPDMDLTLPESSVLLDGEVTDDGQPDPPAAVSVVWTKVSGLGTVTFDNPNVAQTTATFSTAGEYVLRLTADDGLLSNFDDVRVVVNPAGLTGTGILVPMAWGDVTSYKFGRAFNNPPTWDGEQPVGGDTTVEEFMATWEGNGKVSYIDLGPDWVTWRIEQTWTKYIQYRAGAGHPYAELWWDDDKDTTNDGVTETVLNFASQTHDSSGVWMRDVDCSADPVVPQGRYLMLRQPATIPANDVREALIIGHTQAQVQIGDYTGNGVVDTADYTLWADTFGNDGSPGKEDMRADGNNDGVIDTVDYVVWADHFGESINQALNASRSVAPVPAIEPAPQAEPIRTRRVKATSRRQRVRETIRARREALRASRVRG